MFGIDSVTCGDVRLRGAAKSSWLEKPFCRLLHFREGGRADDAARARLRAALGPLRHAASRHGAARCSPTTTCGSPTGSTRRRSRSRWARSTSTTTSRTCASSSRSVGRDAHAISVCQPTVPVMAGVSLMAAAGEAVPRTLTMMGGPIDTRRSPTAVNTFAKTRPLSWFEAKVIQRVPMRYPGFMRRVYPGFLQFAGFVAMNPDRHMESHVEYYHHLVAGDGDERRCAPPLLRRVQRGDGPSRRVLPRDRRARVPEAPAAAGQARWWPASACGPRPSRARRSSPSKASWTTSRATARPRPPRASPGHSREGEAALRGEGRGPLRHLQRAQVPRDDLPAHPRLHRELVGTAATCPSPSRRRTCSTSGRRW